jgi:hypothetical protein
VRTGKQSAVYAPHDLDLGTMRSLVLAQWQGLPMQQA